MVKFEADSGFPIVLKLLLHETVGADNYYALAEGTDVDEFARFILKQMKTTGCIAIVDWSNDGGSSDPINFIGLTGNQWNMMTINNPLPIQLRTFQLNGVDYVGYVIAGQH